MRVQDQGELFPHQTPTTVTAYGQRLSRRLEHLAHHLTPAECGRILGEIALVEYLLDRIEATTWWAGRVAPAAATPAPSAPRAYADPWARRPAPWRSAATWSHSSGDSAGQ